MSIKDKVFLVAVTIGALVGYGMTIATAPAVEAPASEIRSQHERTSPREQTLVDDIRLLYELLRAAS